MQLSEFISNHAKDVYVYGGVDDNIVNEAETRLAVAMPNSLRDYLTKYGALECRYLEFFGLGFSGSSYLNLITRTLELREDGLPNGYIVFQDLGDMHYAVCDTDGSVYEWAPAQGDAIFKELGADFEEYVVTTMQQSLSL